MLLDDLLSKGQSTAPTHLVAYLAWAFVFGELLAEALLRIRCSLQ
jgi:hypothetical protein